MNLQGKETMMSVPRSEHENRVARAREKMRELDMAGLIVTDPLNFQYFTGQPTPAWMKSRASIFVLPLEGEPAMISWSGPGMFARLYGRDYPSWVDDRRIYPDVPFTRDERVDWGLRGVLEDRKLTDAKLGIELGRESWLGIPLVDFERLKEELPHATFVDSGPVVWSCRLIKSEWEIDCLRKACEMGGRAWDRIFNEVKEGDSLASVQKRILAYYMDEGADLNSGPPIVLGATGPNNTFQRGDVLYLDGGPGYLGYRMDYTRRGVFGPPSKRQQEEHDGMWEIMFEVIDRMKPGVPVKELFDYSQKRLSERPEWKNYSTHPALRIGHGIGLENEPPSMSGVDDTVLQVGMVLTPEPKIESVDGLVNPEEQVVIRPDGAELLSDSSDYRLRVIG